MNPSIYDYELPGAEFTEQEYMTMIPYKTIRPLGIKDNKIAILVDIDINNDSEFLSIVRTRSYRDLRYFCNNATDVALKYQYLGQENDFHYFINFGGQN